ncbi:MAG: Gx transporter family protein [Oscillospiraceae bacterium]|nr:Gx transporter family protein [Oscillospiraceae bacterium]
MRINQNPAKKGAKRLAPPQAAAYFGILSALALALSWTEQFLAPLLRLPLGAKPGLSNIAVMVACAPLGLPAGLAVAAATAGFAGVTRGLTAALLSGAGGISSALLVGILLKRATRRAVRGLSEVGVGILGGVTHNLAQLACAMLLMKTPGVFWAAPPLILFGVLAGAATGTLVRIIRKAKFFSGGEMRHAVHRPDRMPAREAVPGHPRLCGPRR